jgi:CRP-like cAMP-binding protein
MKSEIVAARPISRGSPTVARSGFASIRGGQGRVTAAGEHLFYEGDERSRIYVVESGWLKLTRTLSDGQRQIVGFPTRGSILGFESPLHYLNDCEALTVAVVHSFSVSTILQMCRDLRLTETLLGQIGVQLGAAQTQLASVGAQSAPQKMAAFLTSMADTCLAAEDEFAMPMRRGEIGDFLGLRLETVSRTFSAFRQRGWIAMSALYRCRITNRRALAVLASGARSMKSFPLPSPLPSGMIGRRRTGIERRSRV